MLMDSGELLAHLRTWYVDVISQECVNTATHMAHVEDGNPWDCLTI